MAAASTAITLSTGHRSLQRSTPCKTPTPVIRSHGLTLSSWYSLAKVALGGLSLLSADVVCAYWYERDRGRRIDAVLETMGRDRRRINADLEEIRPAADRNIIDRPDAENMVESVIKSPPTKYDVIVGNHGTGKSTLVYRLACRLPGIVYVTVPPAMSPASSGITPENSVLFAFLEDLEAALDWKAPRHSWSYEPLSKVVKSLVPRKHAPLCLFCLHADGFCQAKLGGGYRPMMKDFRRAAARYKAKHKTCAVIIIDNANEIAENDPGLMGMLQLEAKMAADSDLYKTIFVTSGGEAPEMMKSELQQVAAYRDVLIIRADQSAWSRGSDDCRIGDLTASEATKYLEKRGLSQHADKLIHSCGTRILTLTRASDRIIQTKVGIDGSFPILVFAGLDLTHSELIKSMRADALVKFKWATEKMDRQRAYKVAELVLTHGTLDRSDYFKQFGNDKDGEVLLAQNIFAVDDSTGIRIENGILESVIREELARMRKRPWWQLSIRT